MVYPLRASQPKVPLKLLPVDSALLFCNLVKIVFMETVLVQLKHEKAKQLLQNLAEMDLIEIKETAAPPEKESKKISDLRKMMEPPFETNEEIDKKLKQLQNEWERDF